MALRLVALAAALGVVASGAAAQPDFRPAPDGRALGIDVLTAIGDDLAYTDVNGAEVGTVETVTSALVVSAQVPVGPVRLVGEVPLGFVRYQYDSPLRVVAPDVDTGDARLGNPYLGVVRGLGPVELEGGLRLPLARTRSEAAGANASIVGFTLDPERFEAYLPDLLSASVSVRTGRALAPGLRADARLTPALFVEVGDAPDCPRCDTVTNAADAAVGYGLRLTGAVGPAAIHAGVVGRQFLTTERFDAFAVDATVVVGAALARGPVRPGVLVRVPVDDSYFGTDAVVGFNLTLAR